MPNVIEGGIPAAGFRFAIVLSRYNEFITSRLMSGAVEALLSSGVEDKDIDIFKVPGSFELPQMARKVADIRRYDAIICLGALIRGQTQHFQIISEECARGIQRVALEYAVPVTFGVITAENTEQAVERAGEKSENKGWEAAMAAIEMASVFKRLSGPPGS